jgi:hypothetical protein
MKIKKTLFFLIVSFLFVGSIIAQGNPPGTGFPGTPGEDDNTFDTEAPIDGQIWVGLIGGLAIGGYFLMKKRAIKID